MFKHFECYCQITMAFAGKFSEVLAENREDLIGATSNKSYFKKWAPLLEQLKLAYHDLYENIY